MKFTDETHIRHNSIKFLEYLKSININKNVKPSEIVIELNKTEDHDLVLNCEHGWIREEEFELLLEELSNMSLEKITEMNIDYSFNDDSYLAKYTFK